MKTQSGAKVKFAFESGKFILNIVKHVKIH